jgi:hypothetical protein
MNTPTDVWDEVERMLQSMIDLQETKVLALARRLKPGVTAEDVRNAHDHRELDDADLQFEDGTLAGILAAQAAVRARRRGGAAT